MSVHEMTASAQSIRHARRIVVAGNDGSGKTTLCRRLAHTLGLPFTELDSLKYDSQWNELPDFLDKVTLLAAGDTWVTEWDFEGARELLGERTEAFIWIDLPRWRCASSSLLRSVRARLSRADRLSTHPEPPLHTILTDPTHSVRWVFRNHHDSQALAGTFIQDHPSVPSVRLRSRRDVAAFLAMFADAQR